MTINLTADISLASGIYSSTDKRYFLHETGNQVLKIMRLLGKTIVNIVAIWALFAASTSISQADLTPPPDIVKLNVISTEYDGERHVDVSLVPTKTFLANENVPVWITKQSLDCSTSSTRHHLISLNTMKEVGPFTVYWDLNTCSAALYFHKRKQFEGIIGHHHIIHKLNYNSVTKAVEPTEDTIFASPIQKHSSVSQVQNIKDGRVYRRIKSLRYPTTAYIETLVMVNEDITSDFNHDYASIVTYVLSMFNTVDMIFSKVKAPFIKINIAGIIIASEPFAKFSPQGTAICKWITVYTQRQCVMPAVQAFKAIRRTLDDYKEHVPFQSYDIVIFLTRSPLVLSIPQQSTIDGIATVVWNKYKRTTEDLKIALISDPKNFENVYTIAHEIAHLLGAPHDGGFLWSADGSCEGNLMRSGGSRCDKCITFSSKTQTFLALFFGSTDACIFYNEPRSLNRSPEQRLFWNQREQCECYGYTSAHTPTKCLPMILFSSKLVDCTSTLKCAGENGKVFDTNFFMDGTPCARNKKGTSVCWNQKCVPLSSEFHEKSIL